MTILLTIAIIIAFIIIPYIVGTLLYKDLKEDVLGKWVMGFLTTAAATLLIILSWAVANSILI
jgi:Mn2+/Fe2+ NRAMP family transporter